MNIEAFLDLFEKLKNIKDVFNSPVGVEIFKLELIDFLKTSSNFY